MFERPNYKLRPMPIAAEVHDLDIQKLDDPATRKALYDDWLAHGVLVIKGTPVDNKQHLELSSVFGEPELHPLPQIRNDEEPLLMQLGGSKADVVICIDDGELMTGRVPWHRDTAYTVDICKGAMLRVVEHPEKYGQTEFCDTAEAYDALPEEWKKRLEGLEFKATLVLDYRKMKRGVTWDTIRFATQEEAPGSKLAVPEEVIAQYPSVVQPMIATHPESGRKCIYISPTYLDCVLGVSEEESNEILDFVVSHTLQPQFIYSHSYGPDDLVVWDNRRMMHAAVGIRYGDNRLVLRTTLSDPMKTGRLYDPDAVSKKSALVD